jgi:hypothetical protein
MQERDFRLVGIMLLLLLLLLHVVIPELLWAPVAWLKEALPAFAA